MLSLPAERAGTLKMVLSDVQLTSAQRGFSSEDRDHREHRDRPATRRLGNPGVQRSGGLLTSPARSNSHPLPA
jgi:hypothetical protein